MRRMEEIFFWELSIAAFKKNTINLAAESNIHLLSHRVSFKAAIKVSARAGVSLEGSTGEGSTFKFTWSWV